MLPTINSEYEEINNFLLLQTFVANFTQTVTMSNQVTRQGFLVFAGPFDLEPDFRTIGAVSYTHLTLPTKRIV